MTECPSCGLWQATVELTPGHAAYCRRCGYRLARHHAGALQISAALTVAALVLYIPANIFPILRMQLYGAYTENTVWGGCVRLYRAGDVFIAVVVFLASMLVPLLKLVGLLFLIATARLRWPAFRMARARMYRFIEVIGRWAMLDVFVLAVLVSLMKLRALGTVVVGPGAVAFTCVVVLTLLASASFEPRELWRGAGREERLA